ncbi:MAG: DUF2252 domain-containing protein [Dactylosporangium sp.]|nr:DUF2252 domain-containing protein [Dactylosporangium sp.]NNJ60281.1 DUF2252 domain-containing protein [Dactylosporangium sp.]
MISSWAPPERFLREGAERRRATPVTDLTEPRPRPDRPDPVALLVAGNAGRRADLVPLRFGRMAASPFAFLRGASAVMAADLAGRADTGLHGHICGDAHAANFGFYASPERRLVLDVNDFDETGVGPWDWDLKRLTASIVCAGRQAGIGEDACRRAAIDCSGAYRAALRELAAMPLLEAYYLTTDHATLERHDIGDLTQTFDRVRKKAKKNTSRKVVNKSTRRLARHAWRFVEDPPILTRLDDSEAARVVSAINGYTATLSEEIRTVLGRYTIADVAHRVVGLGSVGYRSFVVLLHGNGDDALVLQLKQARASVLAAHLPQPPTAHDGERIVRGQRWMQTVSDVLLGWTTIGGQPYLVRQFRDMKGSLDPTTLRADQLDDYGRVVGVVLARAHAQSIDPRILSGYCEGDSAGAAGTAFDEAFAAFAVRYADQTAADHAALTAAIRTGQVAATAAP